MKKTLKPWIALSVIPFLLTSNVYSDNQTTFLGPTLRAQYTLPILNLTTPFWTSAGVSLLGEAGPKNFRAGGTIGFGIDCASRVKFTGEYLWQKLDYSFFSGNTRRWVQQGAIGGTYQYDLFTFYNLYMPQFDLNAYYSHAPNKTLSDVNGTFTDNDGDVQSFIEQRRIAGSDAFGISPGLRAQPWIGSQIRAFLNYDNVRYHKKYSSNPNASGFGGTVGINQAIFCNLNLDLFASVRRPFNEYGGSINYLNLPFYGLWTVGVFGNYTNGKHQLPNSYNVGLGIDYFMEPCCLPNALPDYKNEHGKSVNGDPAARPQFLSRPDNLLQWISRPAVYMPQVLAIPDNNVTILSSCVPPGLLVQPIPVVTLDLFLPSTVDVPYAQFFRGSNLTFSETHTVTYIFNTGPVTASINSTTGVITVFSAGSTQADIVGTITATDSCGSVSAPYLIEVRSD